MEQDILAMKLIFVAGMSTLLCVTHIVVTLIKRRSQRPPDAGVSHRLDEIAERLARLDTSVDSMAVEIERISEGQRFTTRLLADRGGNPAALTDRSRSGSVTPH